MRGFPAGKLKAVVFDLDGTIYLGSRLIAGADETVRFLREKGMRVLFYTNGSTRTREEVHARLAGLGIAADPGEIYTSAFAAADFLARRSLTCVYCIGAAGLKQEILGRGIVLAGEPAGAKALVVGLDPQFSLPQLAQAMPFREGGRPIIICNRDPSYPAGDGVFLPGCGAIVAAVESACERSADIIIGKPGTYMMEVLCADWGLEKDTLAVVGDSLDSDISMAHAFGCPSFLISRETHGDLPDTIRLEDISVLKEFFRGRERKTG